MLVEYAGPRVVPAAERDGYLDFLRVASVVCILLGHWGGATAWWSGGRVGVNSILDVVPPLAPVSWMLMTVPVLLFVGGFASSKMLVRYRESGRSVTSFIAARMRRLLIPVGVFLGFWLAVEALLHVIDLGGSDLVRGVSSHGVMPFGPLWFIGVYLAIVVLTPVVFALHERFGVAVPTALILGSATIDALRFVAHIPLVGWLNLLIAWLVPFQLGFLYADTSSRLHARRVQLALCVGGLFLLAVATSAGIYPASIGGVPGDKFSNMRPPTLVIVFLSLWQIGFVLLGAPWFRRVLGWARIAAAVKRLNMVTMTLYLWHMTALLTVLLIFEPLGLAENPPSIAYWWVQRPFWLAFAAIIMLGITRVVGRAEQLL
jgi:hypothetical protein